MKICPQCNEEFQEVRSSQKFCCVQCRKTNNTNSYYQRTKEARLERAKEIRAEFSKFVDQPDEPDQPTKAERKPKEPCTCNDYQHCVECRQRERRAAWNQDRVPVYRLMTISFAEG